MEPFINLGLIFTFLFFSLILFIFHFLIVGIFFFLMLYKKIFIKTLLIKKMLKSKKKNLKRLPKIYKMIKEQILLSYNIILTNFQEKGIFYIFDKYISLIFYLISLIKLGISFNTDLLFFESFTKDNFSDLIPNIQQFFNGHKNRRNLYKKFLNIQIRFLINYFFQYFIIENLINYLLKFSKILLYFLLFLKQYKNLKNTSNILFFFEFFEKFFEKFKNL